ncbi:MAG TPA: serine/threonine-protein kinase [Polyangiaceae bacterium]
MTTTPDDDDRSLPESPSFDALLRGVAAAEPRAPVPPPEERLGLVLDGKYRLDALLGRGGMGTVYAATHLGTGREVAVKVLAPHLADSDPAVERFQREARVAGQMRHANVVDVTDFGFAEVRAQRLAYLVMERLHGQTLRDVLRDQGPFSVTETVDVLDQICAAVAEAHRAGVLHRDLKPENIHLAPAPRGYRVKVLDFGIAKLTQAAPRAPGARPAPDGAGDDDSLTRLGATLGTPRYMSPEQWAGGPIDARADIYSLGIVAYEMLAGATPFTGADRPLSTEHAEAPVPPLAPRVRGIPSGVARVIEASLAKDPSARPASAAAFAAGLHTGAETASGLLRRSIALTSAHYGQFFRACLPLGLPLVGAGLVGVTAHLLARAGVISERASAVIDDGSLALVIGGLAFWWMPLATIIIPMVQGALAGRVPRPPSISFIEAWRGFWRGFPSLVAFLVIMAVDLVVAAVIARLVGRAFHVEPTPRHLQLIYLPLSLSLLVVLTTVSMVPIGVFPTVCMIERVGWFRPIVRSFRLMAPIWRAAVGVQLFFTLVTTILPILFTLALSAIRASAELDPFARERSLVIGLLGLFLTPFMITPGALLYVRAREAEGNPLPTE